MPNIKKRQGKEGIILHFIFFRITNKVKYNMGFQPTKRYYYFILIDSKNNYNRDERDYHG